MHNAQVEFSLFVVFLFVLTLADRAAVANETADRRTFTACMGVFACIVRDAGCQTNDGIAS